MKQTLHFMQFPTVTLCAEMGNDRWGAVRKVLNRLHFKCENSTSCGESELLREHFAGFLNKTADAFKTNLRETNALRLIFHLCIRQFYRKTDQSCNFISLVSHPIDEE